MSCSSSHFNYYQRGWRGFLLVDDGLVILYIGDTTGKKFLGSLGLLSWRIQLENSLIHGLVMNSGLYEGEHSA